MRIILCWDCFAILYKRQLDYSHVKLLFLWCEDAGPHLVDIPCGYLQHARLVKTVKDDPNVQTVGSDTIPN